MGRHAKETPLHLAAKSGNIQMIHNLLKMGGRMLDRNADGMTSIHVAAKTGNDEALKKLLESLNGPQRRDLLKIEPHPLHLAAERGDLLCSKIIIKYLKVR